MGLGNLIPGVPAGITYALLGLAVLVVLFHGITTVKGFARMISNVGKPKPKPVNVGTILK